MGGSMQAQIYLKGLNELEKQANQLIKEVNDEKQKLLLAQAKIVRDRIKARAPLGPTGNLKKSTYAVAMPASLSGPAVAFAGIRPRKAPHAHLVEFGTSRAPAHPFIRPAWDSCREEVKKNIELGLKKRVEGGRG